MKHTKNPIIFPITKEEAFDYTEPLEEGDVFKLERLIKVATKEAENVIGMDIAYTENTVTYSEFTGNTIYLNEGNYIGIISIYADDVSIGFDKVIDDGYRFKIELNDSQHADELVLKYYAGYEEDSTDGNLEAIRQYVFVRVDDMFGPEKSSYSFDKLRQNELKASNLLASLKGFY